MNEKATIFDYARMCESINPKCECCPLSRHNNGTGIGCGGLLQQHPDKANEIILKWCKEHPVVTRQDRFLKMFPNADLSYDYIDICPSAVDKCLIGKTNCADGKCSECKKNYWLAEVDENGDT